MGTDGAIQGTRRQGEGSGPLTVSVHASFDELAPLALEWDELAERAGADVYATFDWCRTWWEFYGAGRHLRVALARSGGELVGILPFFRETLWIGGLPARLFRLVGCDHSVSTTGVVIKEGLAKDVIAAWAAGLGTGWDAIHLGPLAGYNTLWRDVASALQGVFDNCHVRVKDDAGPQIVFELPGSFDQYLARLSKKERSNMLRKEKLLRQEHEVTHRVRTGPREVVDAYARFMWLHQALWKGKGRLGHFGDWPRSKEFHEALVRRLSEKGHVLFFELEVDGEVAASKYCFLFGRRIHTFMTGRDDREAFENYSLGTVVFAALVEHAITSGVTTMDAMRGYYDYKVRQGGTVMPLKTITVVRHKARSRVAMKTLELASWLLHTGYYRLWFKRISNWRWLPKGPLWPLWIRSRL